MVNVFGGSIASGPGNLEVVKKVVVTVGKFKDYIDEIQQSCELGLTPYRLHKNADGTFVTPIRVFDVLDNVSKMEIGDRDFTTDRINSKLIYFVKGVVALLCKEIEDPLIGKMGSVGNRGGIGGCGEKGDKGDTGFVGQQGPIGPQGSTGPRGVQCAKGLCGVAGI